MYQYFVASSIIQSDTLNKSGKTVSAGGSLSPRKTPLAPAYFAVRKSVSVSPTMQGQYYIFGLSLWSFLNHVSCIHIPLLAYEDNIRLTGTGR
jgi:hypothetical protein